MRKLISKDCRLILTEITRVVVFAKIVNTIQRASIVINVSQNTIDHMGNIGMKRMFVDVSYDHFVALNFFLQFFFCSL